MKNTGHSKLVALVALSMLALTGCTTEGGTVGPAPTPSSSADATNPEDITPVPQGFEEFYAQSPQWTECDGSFLCSTIEAPMDWDDPNSEAIEIAVQFHHASGGDAMGTILLNPGGPGASGIELVSYAPQYFGEDLVANYNLLGFDPRGVGRSSAIACLDPEAMDKHLAASYNPENPRELARAKASVKAYGQACYDNSGELLGHVDTQNSARDMDLLRALVGDSKLNYLGFSYGTQLGATYAGIYPENVGKMVLDGAIDLRLTAFEQSKQQAVGFENALRAFAQYCVDQTQCALGETADDVMEAVSGLLESLSKRPLATEDPSRVLTQSLAFYGVAQPLYADFLWPSLYEGLETAIHGRDGSVLLELSDDYFGRQEDGTYADNQNEAFTATSCLDSRSDADLSVMEKEAAELTAAAPVMGQFFTFGGIGCHEWPFDVVEQDFDLAAKGAAPILVIGTTNDPATPYVWAQGLAEQLESGVLVTYEGEGHTAYGRGSECIDAAVGAYFVDGVVPSTDPKC